MKNKALYILAIIFVTSSCDYFKIRKVEHSTIKEKRPVARAHNVFLYEDDIEFMISNGMSKVDSAERINMYIDSWTRKQLLIKEAAKNIEFDEAEIERKILQYRYSLMGYKYQSFYVNKNLVNEITDDEIQSYYTQHIDNFTLKQNIIRGKFITLPIGTPRINIRKLIRSKDEEDFEELKTYCLSFATSYQLNDSAWINFDELVKSTPLAYLDNKIQFLKTKKYSESADSTNFYYLKISEYKMSDELSPMEFVRDQIKNIIINKRKIALAKQLEEEVYQNAINNNEIEVYKNQ